jgi:hypothetical protein
MRRGPLLHNSHGRPAALLPGSAYDHIDLTAAAAGADEPIPPIGHSRFGAVSLGHLAALGST